MIPVGHIVSEKYPLALSILPAVHEYDGVTRSTKYSFLQFAFLLDVVETFFYPIFSELASHFRSDDLALFKLALDPACDWMQADDRVLYFPPRDLSSSPDLVLDVVLRNRGTIATAITRIEAEIFNRRQKMQGLPGEGLLFPQITYAVSIRTGAVGVHKTECEPPLIIRGGNLERFKIRVTDTGFAWNGGLRLALLTGNADRLCFPAMRLFT